MTPTPYLQVENLTKSFGDLSLFEDISFGISKGQRIGVVGQNGSGKTTLFQILTDKEPYDRGKITYKRDLRVAYLPQSPIFDSDMSVLEACFQQGNEITDTISTYEKMISSGQTEHLHEVLAQMDLLKAWDYEQRIKQILHQLQIKDYHQQIKTLSGGQVKRIALANTLIVEPELLILDEPTNHLDLKMVEWLEKYLETTNITLLMITHDRYFLDRVCNQILEIDQKRTYIHNGNYSYFVQKKEERIDAQNSSVERAKNLYRKEIEWIRRQPQARGTKAKYRVDAFKELEQKTQQTVGTKQINIETNDTYIGNKIFEMKDVSKSFGTKKILQNFSYTFSRYEKMGIVGENGTGKSTFIKMIMGQIKPDSGNIDVGQTVNFGYYSQDGLTFHPEEKVIDAVKKIGETIPFGKNSQISASQLLQHFLFSPQKQYTPIKKLSGGEKRRLYLCTILMKNPNFLILDEPTNDLDIITLNILEEYLQQFKGCVIVISHDRYFMDKVVDHILVFNGEASIKDFPGNYTQYREWEEKQVKQEKELNATKSDNFKKEAKNHTEKKKKLTFKEQKEFEALEEEIESLEKEKKELENELSSGEIIDNDELLKKSSKIGEIIQRIEAKTDRWLELSQWV